METLIGLVVLFLIYGYRTDYGAMNRDLAMGMSKDAVKDKFNRGGYDVPDPYSKK